MKTVIGGSVYNEIVFLLYSAVIFKHVESQPSMLITYKRETF